MRTCGVPPPAKPETSRFPNKELPHRVFDHAGLGRALAVTRPSMLPSVYMTTSAPRLFQAFAAQWLAYALPYRRFACTLTSADARLGADADRYSFIAVDLHHLLPAGFDRRTKCLDLCSVPLNLEAGRAW